MKRKIFLASSLILVVALSLVLPATPARSNVKKEAHQKQSLEEKFFHKAHVVFSNQDELGLTDKQIEQLSSLKAETKKSLIMKKAEIEVLAVDIKARLWDDPVDVKAVNQLIDKKYEAKKEKAKILVKAYAELKNTLTEKQKEDLKGLYKDFNKTARQYKGSH